jgi:hypothetical protein
VIHADDAHVHGELVIWDHPIEHIEIQTTPADAVRDARMMCVKMLNDFASEMLRSMTGHHGSMQRALQTLYGISYGMGLNICEGRSMSARAAELGVTRAALSKVACAWASSHDLPPSFHQKAAGASESYSMTRRKVVAASTGSNGSTQ